MKKLLFSLFLCGLLPILSRFSMPDMLFSIDGFPILRSFSVKYIIPGPMRFTAPGKIP